MSKLISNQISPFEKENLNLVENISLNNDVQIKENFFDNPTKFYDNFKNNLERKGIPKISIEKLDRKISKIIKHIDGSDKNILIVGNVQSGKTNSFLGTISKSLDENSNLVFIMGGVDNDIYNQNYERVFALFNDLSLNNEIAVFNKNDYKEENKKEEIIKLLKNNKKIIIVSIKNHAVISAWATFLEEISEYIKNSIIVDDESDQFTPNNINQEQKGERASTNRAVYSLLKILKGKNTFVSVTATPYVQILLDEEDYLKPDYAFLIEAGKGYTPLSYFLNEDIYDRDDVTNVIDDNEIEQFKEGQYLGESFYKAILTHIIHSILFYYWSLKNESIIDKIPKMLINPGRKNDSHDQAKNNLLKFIDINIYPKIVERNPEIINFIQNKLNDFNNFLIKTDNHIANKISLDDLINKIESELKSNDNIDVQVINKNKKMEDNKKLFTFYIGSNKLSRGITINSLITTFFFGRTKSVSNADTISQAARWLGYRNDYLFFLTIYLSSELLKDYYNIQHINEQLFREISKYEKDGKSIKELPYKIYLNRDQNLSIATRTSAVAQEIILSEEKSIETLATLRSFFISHELYKSGLDKADNQTLSKLVNEIILKKNDKYNNLNNLSKSKKLKDFPFLEFENIEEFKETIGWKDFANFHRMLDIEKILFDKMIENNKDKKILLAFMQTDLNSNSIKNKYYNRIITDDKITEIPVGKTHNYTGDKYWFDDLKSSDYLIFQIYLIKLRNNDEEPFYKLSVVQKNSSNNKIIDNNYYITRKNSY